jgi:sodium transport system permease protein
LTGLLVTMRGILGAAFGDRVGDLNFAVPLTAVPLLVVTTVLLAFFVAAGMMIFASFARTFKEGQSMVGPFYLLCLLPPLLVQAPDLTLTPKLALIPIANVSLLFRDAIAGRFDLPLVALVLAVEVATVAACLFVARWILQFEEVLIGSYAGSLGKLVKAKLGRRAAEVARDG